MNPDEIYAKTEEGLREIKERTHNLPTSLRSLLIMVDGNRTVAEVLDRARAVRADATAFATLERVGLIARRFGAPSSTGAPSSGSDDEINRFAAARRQIDEAIGTHLGLRGYSMTMRVKRAQNLRDLKDLLPELAQALVRRLGATDAGPIVAGIERSITTG